MSLILSGTDGLSDIDGTAATPAIRGTDANTGIFFPAADTIAFSEGGAEVMRIDSSGNVGIGTSSPSYKLVTAQSSGDLITSMQGAVKTWNFRNQADGTFGYFDDSTGYWRYMYDASNNHIWFNGASAERMRIDSSGLVGIGTNAPSPYGGALVVRKANTGQGVTNATAQFSDATNSALWIGHTSGAANLVADQAITFGYTDGTTTTERMRITSGGDLRLGSLAITQGNADARSTIYGGATDSSPCLELFKGSTTSNPNQVFMRFQTSQATTAAASGSITANGVSNVGFTVWSDRRLKENIVDLPSQLANIMALRPVEFDYKGYENGEGHQLGFIAQEVQEIYPDLVSEGSDGMLTLTDMNKNDARLIKAVQEMKAIIDTQASTITALTARIAALENT